MLTRRRIILVVVSLVGIFVAIFLTRPYAAYLVHLPISWMIILFSRGILFLPLAAVLGFLKTPLRINIAVCYMWVYLAILQSPIEGSIWDQLFQGFLWTITLGTLSVIFLLLVAFACSALVKNRTG